MCSNFLLDAFQDATKNGPYKYLLIDFRQETPDEVRIRTNILEEDDEQFAYLPYKQC